MSEYYNIDDPYSIDNWNHLIQDINNILQNPPEGSDCEPIDVLPEVSDPHKWSQRDITNARDALQQTCPEISFSTDIVKWKAEIIDEIESQMDQAWCDCSGQQGPNVRTIPNTCHHGGDFDGSSCEEMSDGKSGVYNTAVLCDNPYVEYNWSSTYYPPTQATNTSLANQSSEFADDAYDAYLLYQVAWNAMMATAPVIRQKQELIDLYASLVDYNIAGLEACAGNPICEAPYRAAICDYGTEAKEAQETLESYLTFFLQKYNEMVQHEIDCDTNAQQALSLALQMQPRYPVDVNLTGSIMGFLGGLAWKSKFKPSDNGTIREVNRYSSSTALEVLPTVVLLVGSSAWFNCIATSVFGVRISPNGYPFFLPTPYGLVTTTGVPILTGRIRTKCEQWGGNTCPDPVTGEDVEACEWESWRTRYCANSAPGFSDCAYLCAWERSKWSFDYYAAFEGTVYSNSSTKDYTQDQVDFCNRYLNWYDEHPPYDNRHEAYC